MWRISKPILGIFGGAILVGLAGTAAWCVHQREHSGGFALTFLIGLSGVALGWLVGFLASPYSEVEERRFSKYAAAVAAFVSGYLLGKLEPTVNAILKDDNLIVNPVHGARVLLFVIAAIAAAITMYVFRLYTVLDEEARKVGAPPKP